MDAETLQQLKNEIADLLALRDLIGKKVYQQYIEKPMKEERDKLRTAFFSDSLKEAWRKGGKQEGITVYLKLIESIHNDLKNKLEELEDSAKA